MQKIIIKNFGAVKNAEIEIKPILVLIGEQASGKSTIAKLIYFFKSLRDDFFNRIYQDSSEKNNIDIKNSLILLVTVKFYDFFGHSPNFSRFEIVYYYNLKEDSYIKLKFNKNHKLSIYINNNFLKPEVAKEIYGITQDFQKNDLSKYSWRQIFHEQKNREYIRHLSSLVNNIFHTYHNYALFVIAGRNATVSYSDLFEKYLFANLQNKIEVAQKQSLSEKQQTIDENLMLFFIERVVKVRSLFNKYGGSFETLKKRYIENYYVRKHEKLDKIIEKINSILKGKYTSDSNGEKLIIDEENGHSVFLNNASSGQQEAIRILQDIFLVLLEQEKAFRIIEEPEAHLFPVAQKQLIELLAYYANQGNELIITTHSPYVLTVFNNLLFANRVVTKNENAESEVSKIIEKDIRLKQNDFAAYSLTSTLNEAQEVYCEDILNKKTGLINQNYLDTVSELLGNDFNNLYSIHAKSFARK
ncbi:MAG: AAA family ATPase [Chitinophagales bacterium]